MDTKAAGKEKTRLGKGGEREAWGGPRGKG